MPQRAWSDKRERQYEHIKEGLEQRPPRELRRHRLERTAMSRGERDRERLVRRELELSDPPGGRHEVSVSGERQRDAAVGTHEAGSS